MWYQSHLYANLLNIKFMVILFSQYIILFYVKQQISKKFNIVLKHVCHSVQESIQTLKQWNPLFGLVKATVTVKNQNHLEAQQWVVIRSPQIQENTI
jgi:hypothetical protein